jgi:hypothetical protein
MIKLMAIIKQRLSRETVSRAVQMKVLLINSRLTAAACNSKLLLHKYVDQHPCLYNVCNEQVVNLLTETDPFLTLTTVG